MAGCGRSSRAVAPCTVPEAADRPPFLDNLYLPKTLSKRLSYSSRHATRAVIKEENKRINYYLVEIFVRITRKFVKLEHIIVFQTISDFDKFGN